VYVFRGNPFQAHSLEQSYNPTQPFKQEKHKTKSKIALQGRKQATATKPAEMSNTPL
jgi:hypothetical protein